MTYEHFIETERPRELAAVYQASGYLAEPGDGFVTVYTAFDEAERMTIERIADSNGARYDGGGMYVAAYTDEVEVQ